LPYAIDLVASFHAQESRLLQFFAFKYVKAKRQMGS
jgi:hypothetical protein